MSYIFKYRRNWFWSKETVKGHGYIANQDKMILYFPNGSVREIKEWSKCENQLGLDWVAATHKKMEKDANQSIPLNTGN